MSTLKSLVDETTNIKNEIVECRDTLKQILMDKEIEDLENENKLSNLITKVNKITGRRMASGVIVGTNKTKKFSLSSEGSATAITTPSGAYATLSGLDFVPSIIIVYGVDVNLVTTVLPNTTGYFTGYDLVVLSSTYQYSRARNMTSCLVRFDENVNVGNGTYDIPFMSSLTGISSTFNWVAYE